jgi:hypothetical protein
VACAGRLLRTDKGLWRFPVDLILELCYNILHGGGDYSLVYDLVVGKIIDHKRGTIMKCELRANMEVES